MSPNIKAFLDSHKSLLAADLCLSADGGQVRFTQAEIHIITSVSLPQSTLVLPHLDQVSEHQGGILLGLRGI